MTLCSFMKKYKDSYSITNEQKSTYFVNVSFVFGIQLLLLALQFYDLTLDTAISQFLVMTHFDVMLSRLLCAFLMHMLSEPEVRQAIRMWKYVLNHGKARGSAVKLYQKTCGKTFPIPDDPKEVTPELLTQAFNHLKKYQREAGIKCSHEIKPEVEFLLQQTGKNYNSKVAGSFGSPQSISLRDKWLQSRVCKENTFCRDEIYQMFVLQGCHFPGKRADDLFCRANSDSDVTISVEEFIQIYMIELEEAHRKRLKMAEDMVRFKQQTTKGVCNFLKRLVNQSQTVSRLNSY